MAHLLVIDDEATLARNAAQYLARSGHSVAQAGSVAEGLRALDEHEPAALVLDYQLPDGTALDLLRVLRERALPCAVLVLTGHGSIDLAVALMQAGAADLMTKPVALSELAARLQQLLQRRSDSAQLRFLQSRASAQPTLLGDSAPMRTLRERLQRLGQAAQWGGADGAPLPPILITGETGVGKELVARACHQQSLGEQAPFVDLNCAAIPEALLESELFGHERGAFTDARERKSGLLETADGGSLFLDEVAELALPLQAKLLKVLEDGRFRRVGGLSPQRVKVRLIAATHQDLEACVAQGRFRADLYFRLRVLALHVPPLRERGPDIEQLALHFTAQFAQRYRRPGLALSASARQRLQSHPWPGNVRELRNRLEQAVLLASGPAIEAEDLLLSATPASAAETGSKLEQLERAALLQALAQASDNVSQAARLLGISRDTLRYRMDKHGLR